MGGDLSYGTDYGSGWDTADSYAAPVTDQTVPADLAQASQATDNSGTGSGWSGFLQQGLQQVLAYGIAKDAAQSQAAIQRQQATALQPVVSTAGGALSVNGRGLLLVGALVLGVVFLAHAEKG